METKFTVHLIEISSTGPGKDFLLEKESTILGRDEAADIVIEIAKPSKNHLNVEINMMLGDIVLTNLRQVKQLMMK